jgi:hypothetical protein
MDILRDPVWQFVGVVIAVLAFVGPFVGRRLFARWSRPRQSYDVYLSYPGDDREAVASLMQALEALGLEVFMDIKLPSGEDWQVGLDQALHASRAIAFCITPNSRQASGQQQEIGKALSLGDKIRIMPVLFPGVQIPDDIPPSLRRFMRVDLRSGVTEATLASIVQSLEP